MSAVFPIEPDSRYRAATATAGQTAFTVPFPFQDNADIVVIKTPAATGISGTLEEGDDYTLSGAGSPSGGTMTLTPAAAAGDRIEIVGQAVLSRLGSIVAAGRYASAVTDSELDRNRIIQQEQARDIGRAWKSALGLTGGIVVPGQAGQVPFWNAAGNLVPGSPLSEGLIDPDPALAAESDNLAPSQTAVKGYVENSLVWQQAGTGAVPRTVSLKLKDAPITPQDFGAKADSSGTGLGTDDQAAFQAAIAAAIAERKAIFIPGGAYRLGSELLADLSALTNITDPRFTFRGAGAGVTLLYFDNGDFNGLHLKGGIGAGSSLMSSVGGFNARKADLLGSGLKVEDVSYGDFREIYASGWNRGLEGLDTLSMRYTSLELRFNNYGLRLARDGGSQPNSHALVGCVIGNNNENGLDLVRPGNVNMFGGSLESNGGSGTTATKGGASITEGGSTQAGVSLGLFGVYLENNVGTADILIDNSVGEAGVYAFHGCSFQRISGSSHTTNIVRVTGSSPVLLGFKSCSFKALGTYTPDAGRPYIDISANAAAQVDMDGSNYQESAIEAWRNDGAQTLAKKSAVPVSVSSSTSEETLATVTIPANSLGPNGMLEIVTDITVNNNSNPKVLKIKFGGTQFAQYSPTTNALGRYFTPIANRNSETSQVGGQANTSSFGGFGVTTSSIVTASIDTTVDQNIVITGQKPSSASDVLTLERYSVKAIYGK